MPIYGPQCPYMVHIPIYGTRAHIWSESVFCTHYIQMSICGEIQHVCNIADVAKFFIVVCQN